MAKSSSSKRLVFVVQPFVPPSGDILSVLQKRKYLVSQVYGQYNV